ncbi:MAG: hypothetical protein U9Q83_01795 [Bacteroidota bacterium]|nr:hypothetical protein [Bacteroidota bacterium]
MKKLIYWKNALELLKQGKDIQQDQIDYKKESIHRQLVQELNNYGIRVPKELIDYDDDNIDFSDIPEVNEETLSNGTYKIELPVTFDTEIAMWLKKSKLDYNKIINSYLRTFYNTINSYEKDELILNE